MTITKMPLSLAATCTRFDFCLRRSQRAEINIMAEALLALDLEIDGVVFPATVVKPPGSSKSLFLGGAGVRSLQIEEKEIKFTSIGVYLEMTALESLALKWKKTTPEELENSLEFFKDIVTGNFEKFVRVTMILPLTGKQYSEKVAENCVAYWKSVGMYSDAEANAVEKFKEAFKEENFPPGSSILFTQFPSGTLSISFSTDSSLPELAKCEIENEAMSKAVLESIIGKNGVSPAVKRSLANRISELLKSFKDGDDLGDAVIENGGPMVEVES